MVGCMARSRTLAGGFDFPRERMSLILSSGWNGAREGREDMPMIVTVGKTQVRGTLVDQNERGCTVKINADQPLAWAGKVLWFPSNGEK